MKIAIVTTGRFHVLDLARELHELGHSVNFYSYLPRARCVERGLPGQCHDGLLPFVSPVAFVRQFAPASFQNRLAVIANTWVDSVAAFRLQPCDVLIGMSGIAIQSAQAARHRYGATVFIERSSEHIQSQREKLLAMPGGRRSAITASEIVRELRSYEVAHVITVPSRHAADSFLERGIAPDKLFRNAFGVDLDVFRPTSISSPLPRTAIFTGLWCYEKGCDLLWEACRRAAGSWRLLHVGPVGDAELPRSTFFEHIEAVPQNQLPKYYGSAHIAVLTSRQDGYGMVLNQAAACGLPIVCTDKTGGADLNELIGGSEFIHIVPAGEVDALGAAIEKAFEQAEGQTGLRDYLGAARDKVSWRAYAERYSAELQRRRGAAPSRTSGS